MNDISLIEKYLSYYECVIDYGIEEIIPGQVYDDLKVRCSFGFDNTILNKSKLIKEVVRLYGDNLTEDNLSTSDIVNMWFENKVKEYFKPILDSLKEVQIIFGWSKWEVKKDGKDYSVKDLIEEHKYSYSYNTIKKIFETWKHEEIIRISEEMLNN